MGESVGSNLKICVGLNSGASSCSTGLLLFFLFFFFFFPSSGLGSSAESAGLLKIICSAAMGAVSSKVAGCLVVSD